MRAGSSGERPSPLYAAGMNLAVEAATAEAVRALRAAGVRSLLLKGPPQTRLLYPEGTSRFSVDVDLLVAPGEVRRAEEALARRGFVLVSGTPIAVERPWHAREWVPRTGGVGVDLHTSLIGIGAGAPQTWEVLTAETERLVLAGSEVEIPAPAGQALVIALHAANHGASWPVLGEDLARALALFPDPVWRAAADLAGRLDATAAFTLGLGLVPAGRALCERLGLEAGQASVDALLRTGSAPELALALDWLSRLPGARSRARYIAGKLVPSPMRMRVAHSLARRGRFGLWLAYAWRPVSLLLRLGPALWVWSRARNAAHGSKKDV